MAAWGFGASHAAGEVIVRSRNGEILIGESVVGTDTNALLLKISHSLVTRVPLDAIESCVTNRYETPRYRATDPAEPARPLDGKGRAELAALIEDYFGDTNRTAEALLALQARDALAPEDVPFAAGCAFAAARSGTKLREGDFTFEHPLLRGSVHVEVHRGQATPAETNPPPRDVMGVGVETNAASADRFALAVLLHGGGLNDGHWSSGTREFVQPFRETLGNTVFLFPTVLQKRYAEWGSYPEEEAYVKELIKAAKRTWPIDTDRVYCAGFSMGAYGTWHFGGHQADVFAGLVSGAGGILMGRYRGEAWGWGILSNLAHTRIRFHHAKDDGPSPVWSDQKAHEILTALGRTTPGQYEHQYVEFEKGGHGAGGRGLDEATRWVAGHRRDACPKWVVWEPSRPFIRHFYWLHAAEPQFFSRFTAGIEGNTVRVTTEGPSGDFSVLLNEHLVDMSQPVTVFVNGECLFQGMVRPSLTAVLQSIEDKLDERMWFWARIGFAPGKQ